MTLEEVKQKILSGFEKAYVEVTGDGCNCQTVVITDEFVGMTRLARQRQILATVKAEIASGELHALSIKAYTTSEYNINQANDLS